MTEKGFRVVFVEGVRMTEEGFMVIFVEELRLVLSGSEGMTGRYEMIIYVMSKLKLYYIIILVEFNIFVLSWQINLCELCVSAVKNIAHRCTQIKQVNTEKTISTNLSRTPFEHYTNKDLFFKKSARKFVFGSCLVRVETFYSYLSTF